MEVIAKINVEGLAPNTMMNILGLGNGNEVQKWWANRLVAVSSPYTPFKQGTLRDTQKFEDDFKSIVYVQRYSRYMWRGKLYVDPITRKGAFYDPRTGRYWSRKGVKKEETDIDLNYFQGPTRGPRWVERAYFDNRTKLESELTMRIVKNAVSRMR